MEVTIRDIAKKCGVGVSTVSRAINNHPDINPQTKAAIMAAIAELHYVPNNSARNLKRTDNKTIAVLIKGVQNHLFDSLVHDMGKEIVHNKYSFVFHHVDEREDEVDVALELIKEKRLRGIVFLGGLYRHSNAKLRQIQVPFVLSTMGPREQIEGCVYSYFSVDDRREAYKVTDYLCRLGHQRIAILAALEDDASIGSLRLAGYQEALRDHGLPVDPQLIRYANEKIHAYSMASGYAAMQELLREGAEFTAVFAISDMQAIGACKAIFQAGRQIPADYSVAGFDGVSDTFYYEPSITTLEQPVHDMAQASIQALFKMIKSKESVPGKVFEGELLKRESTQKL